MVKSSLKAEEKKTESEQNEDENQQNKKWIESLEFENLLVEDRRTHEEQQRTVENLHWIAYGNIFKALRKHLDFDFLHGITFFHSKHLKYTT